MYRTIKFTVCLSCIIIIALMSSYVMLIRRMPIATANECTNEQALLVMSQFQQEYEQINSGRTKKDYKKLIEDDFNCHFYFYNESELPEGVDGQCQPMFRSITISNKIDSFYYCVALAHEMIHLTGYIQQENYVTYQTFLYLYEHEDIEFHNFGIRVGMMCLNNAYPTEYDCIGEIIDYMQNKGQTAITAN